MLRSSIARVAKAVSRTGAPLASLASAAPLARTIHHKDFITPAHALKVNGPAEQFKAIPNTVPFEYLGFRVNADRTAMWVDSRTEVQKKLEKTASGDPRFFFQLTNPNDPYVIKADVRTSWSKERNEYERMHNGRMPAVINSPGRDSKALMIFVDAVDIQVLSEFRNIYNAIYHIEVPGYPERFRCLIRDYTEDTTTGKANHVSFMTVDAGHTFEIEVPVVIEGALDSIATKRGGLMLQPTRSLIVDYDHGLACKLGISAPPRAINVNVVDFNIGDTVHSFDVALPPWLRLDTRFEQARHVLCTFRKP